MNLIVIQSHLWTVFQSFLTALQLGFSLPFHFHAKINFSKKEV